MVTCVVQSHQQCREGNKYFLLLVDNLNKYMWVVVIPSTNRVVQWLLSWRSKRRQKVSPA
jgi:hypothetical protein